MPARRQSMRFSGQTSTVTVTKTSVSNIVSSTAFSPKRGRNILSLESFSDISSPQWIPGSDIVFKTPKSPPMSRRSTIHVQHSTKNRNDMDFKIPSLMFSSPPGVKTRSRRSSMYESSQQKNTSSRVQKQQGKARVKRVGKTAKSKNMETRVVLTDVSLVSSPVGKTKKMAKGKLGRELKSPVKSSRSKNASLSPIKIKSSSVSSRSTFQKLSPPGTSQRRETRHLVSTLNESVTSPTIRTANKQKAEREVSSAERRKTAETDSKGKVTTPLKRKGKSPTIKSPPSKKVESVKRKSLTQARNTTVSPQGKQASPDKLSKSTAAVNACTSESPKRTPSQRVKKTTRSAKKKANSPVSPRKTKRTPKRRSLSSRLEVSLEKLPPDFGEQKQESPSKGKQKTPAKKSPQSKKSRSSKRVSDPKLKKSTPSLQREESPLTKQTPQTRKSPQSKKGQSTKRKPNLRNRSTTLLSQKVESSSKLSQKSSLPSTADTPKTKNAQVLKKTPNSINKKTPPVQRKDSPSKRKQKSPSIKSPQTKKEGITRSTPNRRGTVQELRSDKKQTSSSTKTKKSPAGKASLVKRADITLRNTPDQIVTSRSSRVVNLVEKLRTVDGQYKNTPSLSRNVTATQQKRSSIVSPQPTGLFYGTKATKSSGKEMKSAVSPPLFRDLKSLTNSIKEKVEISRSQISPRWKEKSYATSRAVASLTRTAQDKSSPISSRDSLSSARRSKRSFITSERLISSDNLRKTLEGENPEKSSDSSKSLSHSPWKKSRLETEDEEIDRMVNTMVQASSYQKRRSPSRSVNVSKASPARVTILKEMEAQALLATAVPLSGRKSLHVTRNITPSAAAPKARKILGVFDSPATKVETSQSYKSEQRSESSSLISRQYGSRRTENYAKGLDLQRDDDDEEEKEEDGEGSELSEQFAEESGSEEKEEISIQEDETITDSEADAAAPKAKKILGVFDSRATKVETSQSYKREQRSESSSLLSRQYGSRRTENYAKGLDLQRNDDDEEEEEEEEEGSELSEQFAEESGSEEKEERSIQEDETITDSETDEDDMYDQNITLSHTSQSQRCTIS